MLKLAHLSGHAAEPLKYGRAGVLQIAFMSFAGVALQTGWVLTECGTLPWQILLVLAWGPSRGST